MQEQITKVDLPLTCCFTLPITEEAMEQQLVVHGDVGSCVENLVEYFQNENENNVDSI